MSLLQVVKLAINQQRLYFVCAETGYGKVASGRENWSNSFTESEYLMMLTFLTWFAFHLIVDGSFVLL